MIVIPAAVVPKTALAFGSGYLYFGAAGVAAPTNTVSGSVFTDTPNPANWFLLGVTREGHAVSIEYSTDPVEAAEYPDPLLNVLTSRNVSMATDLMQIHATNLKRALNGGTIATSGSGATLLSTYTLPAIGAEVRAQLLWEATDNTERWLMPQVFMTGTLEINRKKGADNASLPVEFTAEPDTLGNPYYHYFAGATRG